MIKKGILDFIKGKLEELGLDMKTPDIRYAYVAYYIYVDEFPVYFSYKKMFDYVIAENNMQVSRDTFERSFFRTKNKLIKLGFGDDIYKIVDKFR